MNDDEKMFFKIGASDYFVEYRASLAWEILRTQIPAIRLSEAFSEKGPTAASDMVDAAFSLADCFVDRLKDRDDLRREPCQTSMKS